jgi:hypothetical protein
MKATVRALAVILAVAVVALGGFALQKGSEKVTESRQGEQLVALLDYETNNGNADSAPQQQVVNGWVAKDLAIVQLNQLGDLTKAQEQTNKILGLGVAAISLTAVLLMLLVVRPRQRFASQATPATLLPAPVLESALAGSEL